MVRRLLMLTASPLVIGAGTAGAAAPPAWNSGYTSTEARSIGRASRDRSGLGRLAHEHFPCTAHVVLGRADLPDPEAQRVAAVQDAVRDEHLPARVDPL